MRVPRIRIVVLLVSFSIIFCSLSCSKKSDETTRLNDFIREYNQHSNPAAFQEGKITKFFSNSKKLEKMLAHDCIVTCSENDIEYAMNGKEFIEGIEKSAFSTQTETFVLGDISIEKVENGYVVFITKAFTDNKGYSIAECQLKVKSSPTRFLIQEIKRSYRKATVNEITMVKKIVRGGKYNPKKGLGARYLGWPGGMFNASLDISPDCNEIVFTSLRNNSSELYLIDINGSNMQRLTNTQYWEINPMFSPEGKNILFFSDEGSYSGHPYYIELNSGSVEKIGIEFEHISEICYSQNGKMLGIIGDKGAGKQVYVCDRTCDKMWPITANEYDKRCIVFSNDSKQIYFTQKWYDSGLIEEIFRSRIDGSEFKQITNDKSKKKTIAITNDLEIIYVKSNKDYRNEIYVMDIQGNNHKHIYGGTTNGAGNVCLSPDGRSVLFVDDITSKFEYDIYSLDLSKGSLKRLTYENGFIIDFVVSSNGKYLIYMKDKKSAPGRGKCEICLTPVDIWERKLITKNY